MERKLSIIIICLAAILLVGGFALAWKNKDMLLAKAHLGGVIDQQWIEIKPRTDGGENKNSGQELAGTKTTKTAVAASELAAKKPAPAQIQWCVIAGAKPQRSSVIINEAAWMGTVASYSNEWIELKNRFHETVDISGWQLQNKNKNIKISFPEGSAIASNGLYLLERTDDDTLAQTAADLIYSGGMANSNEALYLFDNACSLQDLVIAAPKWPAGDNTSKKTMERVANFLWQTSAAPGGTPKQENSVY